RCQLKATEPLKKQLWKQTVQAKIRNQAAVVEWLGRDGQPLRKMASRVGSGDSENIEGQAAFLYWQLLFSNDSGFIRHRYGPPPNHMLNYAYAILRAVIARSLVASGCLPAGYFGGIVPVISVKPCHFKRSYNDIKKLILFLFQYSFTKRLPLQVNSMG